MLLPLLLLLVLESCFRLLGGRLGVMAAKYALQLCCSFLYLEHLPRTACQGPQWLMLRHICRAKVSQKTLQLPANNYLQHV
jgi:hypothetical protein